MGAQTGDEEMVARRNAQRAVRRKRAATENERIKLSRLYNFTLPVVTSRGVVHLMTLKKEFKRW